MNFTETFFHSFFTLATRKYKYETYTNVYRCIDTELNRYISHINGYIDIVKSSDR